MNTNAVSSRAGDEVATRPAPGTDGQAAQPQNTTTTRFVTRESSLTDLLRRAASQYPNRAAYKFIDYEGDPAGFTETLTWWQVYRRAVIVAEELGICASSGDRVAIVAPQGLEYIVAFLGALQAGLIAVPLPVPQFGIHDERISAALRDSCRPSSLRPRRSLTRSQHMRPMRRAGPCTARHGGGLAGPGLPARARCDLTCASEHGISAVHIGVDPFARRCCHLAQERHHQLRTANVRLLRGFQLPSTAVSWLPFYHDMGLVLGIFLPMINQDTAVLLDPMAFCNGQPAGCNCWANIVDRFPARRISASNWRCAEHRMTIWPDLISATCARSSRVPNA